MNPTKPRHAEGHAIVDLLDVLLRDGVMVQADVVITVGDIPLVGLNLRLAIAGMATMTEYGFFEDWDAVHRDRATGSVAYTPSRDGDPWDGMSRYAHHAPSTERDP